MRVTLSASKRCFSCNSRRYTTVMFEPLPAELKYALTRNFGGAVQVDRITTRGEGAYLWFRCLELEHHKLLSTFAFSFNLRRYDSASSPPCSASSSTRTALPTSRPCWASANKAVHSLLGN